MLSTLSKTSAGHYFSKRRWQQMCAWNICSWRLWFSRHSPLCLEVVEKSNKCKRVWLPCFWEGQFQLFYGRLLARFTIHRLTKLVELGPYNYTVVCCPIVCRYCSNLLTTYCELSSHDYQIASPWCEIRCCNVIVDFVNVLSCFVRNNPWTIHQWIAK